MNKLVLEYPSNESISSIVSEALKLEEKELLTALLKIKEHLSKFENRYNLTTHDFISQSPTAPNIDNMEALEWSGEYETLKLIEDRLNRLREIIVCT
ncbi:MAG: hypothetical protein V1872_01175 [bacterium]